MVAAAAAADRRSCCRPIPTSPPTSSHGRRRRGRADRQQRAHLHLAETVGRSGRRSAQQVIARLRPKLGARSRAPAVTCRPAQDVRVGGRLSKARSTSTPCRTPTLDELYAWAPQDPAEAAHPAELRDVADRPADRRHHRDADHRPRRGRPLRHPAAGDRRHALRRVRPAPGDAVLHPGEHLPPDPGGAARAAERPGHARQALRQVGAPARRCRCRTFVKVDTTAPVRRCRSATRASSRR